MGTRGRGGRWGFESRSWGDMGRGVEERSVRQESGEKSLTETMPKRGKQEKRTINDTQRDRLTEPTEVEITVRNTDIDRQT